MSLCHVIICLTSNSGQASSVSYCVLMASQLLTFVCSSTAHHIACNTWHLCVVSSVCLAAITQYPTCFWLTGETITLPVEFIWFEANLNTKNFILLACCVTHICHRPLLCWTYRQVPSNRAQHGTSYFVQLFSRLHHFLSIEMQLP